MIGSSRCPCTGQLCPILLRINSIASAASGFTRRILVIGTMIALRQWEEFVLHARTALTEGGFSADDLKEIILQQTIYCGAPAANHAFKLAGDLVKETGKG